MKISHVSLTTVQLRVLDNVLRSHNVSRAGDDLGLTQSAISHTLALLRRHYDDELLVRRGRTMELTPFAEALKEPVRSVLRQIEDVSSLREQFDPAALTRNYVIAARDLTLSLFAPALIARFYAEAPTASFGIVPWEADRLAEQLATGVCDLAIGVDPPGDDSGLRMRKLYQDDYVVACARRSAPPGALSLDDLVRRPAIVASRTDKSASPVDEALAARGLARHVVMRSAYFLAALSVVAGTELLMVVPRRLAQRHASDFNLAIFDVPLSLPSFAVYSVSHERFATSPMHRWLYRLTTEAVIESAMAPRAMGLSRLNRDA